MPTTQHIFINQIAPSAVKSYQEKRISAALTISQGCLESGFGQFAPGNNMFGIKADPSWHGAIAMRRTTEYDAQGNRCVISAPFRVYPTLGDSLTDHTDFLLENERYHNLIGVSWEVAVNEIAKVDGYATDPNYSALLTSIIRDYNLDKYDMLQLVPPAYPELEVFVNSELVRAISVRTASSSGTYILWTALDILKSSYKKLNDRGLFLVNGSQVQGIVHNGEAYLPWAFIHKNMHASQIGGIWHFTA
jgi:hypothetical protein